MLSCQEIVLVASRYIEGHTLTSSSSMLSLSIPSEIDSFLEIVIHDFSLVPSPPLVALSNNCCWNKCFSIYKLTLKKLPPPGEAIALTRTEICEFKFQLKAYGLKNWHEKWGSPGRPCHPTSDGPFSTTTAVYKAGCAWGTLPADPKGCFTLLRFLFQFSHVGRGQTGNGTIHDKFLRRVINLGDFTGSEWHPAHTHQKLLDLVSW